MVEKILCKMRILMPVLQIFVMFQESASAVTVEDASLNISEEHLAILLLR